MLLRFLVISQLVFTFESFFAYLAVKLILLLNEIVVILMIMYFMGNIRLLILFFVILLNLSKSLFF